MQSHSTFNAYAKYYDGIYLKMKDYRKEAEVIKRVIKQFQGKQPSTLLDVGCGTGEHLKYLSSDFKCVGADINPEMLRIAHEKVPSAEFTVADMCKLKLKNKFDIITCLFSSIGYVQTLGNLIKTLKGFYDHLNDGGLVIVEPWIFKSDFKKGHIGMDTYEGEGMKLVRMATSKLTHSKWLIYMHYLIGEESGISHFEEVHEMLALEYSDYVEAFKAARLLNVRFLRDNLWEGCRGLFTATKS